ncbi:MAG: hypothetical protein QM817_27170 [Archangium sp.]
MQQVESRLTKWLSGGGDLVALTATPAEIKAHPVPAAPESAGLKDFTANRALIEYVGKVATLHLYDEAGHVCEVLLLAVGTSEALQRYVLLDAPRTYTRSFDDDAKALKDRKEMLVFIEKSKAGWNTGSMPEPPPPDCMGVIKGALQTIFDAEKKYFTANTAYSGSLTKIGVDAKTLGITSAKVSVSSQTFTIRAGVRGGEMTMNEKGETAVIAPCAAP